MEVSYKKDLRHNYMVIKGNENNKTDSYSIKMLECQTIEGILPVEQRRMDNNILIYYDITAKQSMTAILEKATLSYYKVKQLCTGIIDTIERAYEYLLPEDDFLLIPEHIYIDVVTNKPALCFLPGYDKLLKEQMSSLIEYLMNKVDYNDKEAVLLVYQLYAVSREEGYTFDYLNKVLQEKPQAGNDKIETGRETYGAIDRKMFRETGRDIDSAVDKKMIRGTDRETDIAINKKIDRAMNKKINRDIDREANKEIETEVDRNICRKIGKESDSELKRSFRLRKNTLESLENIESGMPVMMEKLEGEEEISCYSIKTFLYTGVSIAAVVFLIGLSFYTKILYNSFGSRIDYSKFFALLLIAFCVEGYLLKLIWDKKNRITKMIAKNEYVDPRQEYSNFGISGARGFKNIMATDQNLGASLSQPILSTKDQQDLKSRLPQDKTENELEEDNPTCLLNATCFETTVNIPMDGIARLILNPIDEANYQPIPITEFPFFIGKLKKNVDYYLENDLVSRYHAKITKEEDVYYITDLNSTNGTFVNSEAVQTYQKQEIKTGDEIAFANIKYKFNASPKGL